MKKRAKAWLGRAALGANFFRRVLGGNGVVVAFHRVSRSQDEDGLTVTDARFELFCRLFREHFDVVTLDEYVGRLTSGRSVGGALAITFDDGYLDNGEVAAPILKALGLPATFFVATRFIGTAVVPWWDRALPRQPGWMTWDHVRELATEGFDVAPHTRTHVDLGITAGEDARVEIVGAREDLLAAIGRCSHHFAYPYGGPRNMLESNRELVKKSGFRSCLSCHGGLAPNGTDPYRVRRVPVSPWFESTGQFAYEIAARSLAERSRSSRWWTTVSNANAVE